MASSYRFESTLQLSKLSSQQQQLSSFHVVNSHNYQQEHEILNTMHISNHTVISHDGIALLKYIHEQEGGTIEWEVIFKQNLTRENFVLVLAHSDFVNETNIGEYFRNNRTKYVIELG